MASTVFSVGLELPGGVAETVPFRSSRSVFDADVVVFAPSISTYHSHESYAGHRLISERDSASLMKDLAHWKAELGAALSSGKTVFIVLSKPEDAYYHT